MDRSNIFQSKPLPRLVRGSEETSISFFLGANFHIWPPKSHKSLVSGARTAILHPKKNRAESRAQNGPEMDQKWTNQSPKL